MLSLDTEKTLTTEKQKQVDAGRNVRTISLFPFKSGAGGPANMAVQNVCLRVDLGQTFLPPPQLSLY